MLKLKNKTAKLIADAVSTSFGEGLLNVSKVKTGAVTLVRLAQVDGELILHAVRGEAKTPETWEEAGWAPPAPQLPSTSTRASSRAMILFIAWFLSHYS